MRRHCKKGRSYFTSCSTRIYSAASMPSRSRDAPDTSGIQADCHCATVARQQSHSETPITSFPTWCCKTARFPSSAVESCPVPSAAAARSTRFFQSGLGQCPRLIFQVIRKWPISGKRWIMPCHRFTPKRPGSVSSGRSGQQATESEKLSSNPDGGPCPVSRSPR